MLSTSPVNALSLICKDDVSINLPSPLIISPASTNTTSPKVNSLALISYNSDSLRTFTLGIHNFFKLSNL